MTTREQPGSPEHPLRAAVTDALRTVHDPEIPINIYDLGLIYDLAITDDSAVHVRMTLTAPNCPMADVILEQVQAKVSSVPGVAEASVELVWDPPWNPEMMSEAAKLELEFTGQTGPAHLRKSPFTSLRVDRGKNRRPRS